MTIKYVPSNAGIVHAVQKSEDAPYGIAPVQAIQPGVPCIILFGGDLTSVPRFANHYIKQIKQVFAENDIHGVQIYSVYYEFGSREAEFERVNLFRAAGHKLRNIMRKKEVMDARIQHMNETEPVPNYLGQLYQNLAAPILAYTTDGKPDVAATEKNAAMVRMYAHSHGAAVVRMLGDIMAQEMRKMKFTNAQIKQIQNKIIVIQHSPVAPLENPRFTTLSFASASDTRMNLHNEFSEYAYNNSANMYPSYFPQGGAHLFTAGQTIQTMIGEHDNMGLVEKNKLTDDGKILFSAEANAIANAMRAAINGKTDLTIAELVSGNGIDFQELKKNGNWFYEMMLRDIKRRPKQNPVHDNQK